jgi:hypothetical protein
LNASAKADLYAEIATGAESGWDYTVRWVKYPVVNKTDEAQTLRGLNIRSIIPVDLNALLAGDHALVSRNAAQGRTKERGLMLARGHVRFVLQLIKQQHCRKQHIKQQYIKHQHIKQQHDC